MEFVKIPRSLIYDISLSDKRALIYSSLFFFGLESTNCYIPDLISFCGYGSDRHSDSIELQFAKAITDMSEFGLISIGSFHKKSFSFSFNIPANNFGIIYKHEYDDILSYRKSQKEIGQRINHAHLLLLISYIRVNMFQSKTKMQVHFSMLKTIAEKTGLSTRSVSSGIKILELLDIIYVRELPRYYEEGKWHTNVKVFVNKRNYIDAEYDCDEYASIAIENMIHSQH